MSASAARRIVDRGAAGLMPRRRRPGGAAPSAGGRMSVDKSGGKADETVGQARGGRRSGVDWIGRSLGRAVGSIRVIAAGTRLAEAEERADTA